MLLLLKSKSVVKKNPESIIMQLCCDIVFICCSLALLPHPWKLCAIIIILLKAHTAIVWFVVIMFDYARAIGVDFVDADIAGDSVVVFIEILGWEVNFPRRFPSTAFY